MSALSQLIKEVLEFDAKATKGPWEKTLCILDGALHSKGGEGEALVNAELIAHYRTTCVKLALAAQRMEQKLEHICSDAPFQGGEYASEVAEDTLSDVQNLFSNYHGVEEK